jgi:methylmalonyl-CoA mutase cobalamin-binding subunit
LVQQVLDEFAARNSFEPKPIVVGGTISKSDSDLLRTMGVADVFPVKSPLEELAPRVAAVVRP